MKDNLTRTVIGSAFKVYNQLGFGFLESVYGKGLSIELSNAGVAFESQSPICVYYHDQVVGQFMFDLLVEKRLVVELKSVRQLVQVHEVQLVNYLTATRIDDGLLINFGPTSVEVKRKYREYKKQ